MREIKITPENEGQRLDKYLMKYMNTAPKAFIYKMLRKKNIVLNGKRAEGGELLERGDEVRLFLAENTLEKFMEAREIAGGGEVCVLYEDDNILVCDKPAGLLSQPQGSGDCDTMIGRVLSYLHEKSAFSAEADSDFTPALANRLDRNTGGIVVCGKNSRALQELNRIIRERKLEKYYVAVVHGGVDKPFRLQTGYKKNPETNKAEIVPGGSEIITEFEPIKRLHRATLLRVKLVTGKSHQIRLHLSSVNHPIAGDRKYGNAGWNRELRREYGLNTQLLHAEEIIFTEETGFFAYMLGKSIKSPLPPDFSLKS